MKRMLDVYLHRRLAGNLVQDEHGQITFEYAQALRMRAAKNRLTLIDRPTSR